MAQLRRDRDKHCEHKWACQRRRRQQAGRECRYCRQWAGRFYGWAVRRAANLSPLLITGNDYGGQVSITYDIENYPGFPESLSGPELVDKFKAQAEKFGTRVEFDYVSEIEVDRHPFVVRTTNGAEYYAKSLIISTGARPRYLEVPGEKEYTGKGISYCATCDGFFFRGKDVLVVGGGDSATEEALFLTRYASRAHPTPSR